MHGTKALLVAAVHAGEPADADAVLAPFRSLATPLVDLTAVMPYTAAQAAFDAFFPDGGRYYFKSHFLDELTDDAIATLIACDAARPTKETLVGIRAMGGAIDDTNVEDSAYPHRRARFNLSLDGVWSDPADDPTVIDWVRRTWTTMQPFAKVASTSTSPASNTKPTSLRTPCSARTSNGSTRSEVTTTPTASSPTLRTGREHAPT